MRNCFGAGTNGFGADTNGFKQSINKLNRRRRL